MARNDVPTCRNVVPCVKRESSRVSADALCHFHANGDAEPSAEGVVVAPGRSRDDARGGSGFGPDGSRRVHADAKRGRSSSFSVTSPVVYARCRDDGRALGPRGVREARRDSIAMLKDLENEGGLGKDERHRADKQVQDLTDSFTAQIDGVAAEKENEVLEV